MVFHAMEAFAHWRGILIFDDDAHGHGGWTLWGASPDPFWVGFEFVAAPDSLFQGHHPFGHHHLRPHCQLLVHNRVLPDWQGLLDLQNQRLLAKHDK
jgi:hypothetical protein